VRDEKAPPSTHAPMPTVAVAEHAPQAASEHTLVVCAVAFAARPYQPPADARHPVRAYVFWNISPAHPAPARATVHTPGAAPAAGIASRHAYEATELRQPTGAEVPEHDAQAASVHRKDCVVVLLQAYRM
jgi:hypothetical protein